MEDLYLETAIVHQRHSDPRRSQPLSGKRRKLLRLIARRHMELRAALGRRHKILGRMLGPRSQANYDAFLSHAWEDKPTVEWIASRLTRYWVPFHRRRRIFVDTERLSAGGLTELIRSTLSRSRFLIVCLSPAAIESKWVNLEIGWWLDDDQGEALERLERLRFCWVGDDFDAEQVSIPAALVTRGHSQWFRDQLVIQINRSPSTWSAEEEAARSDDSLGLLAPLVGLVDKQDVVAKRRKSLIRAAAALLATAVVVASATSAISSWRQTPAGRFDTALETAIADAAANEMNLVYVLFDCVAALGRVDLINEAEALANAVVETEYEGETLGLRGPILLAAHAFRPTVHEERLRELLAKSGDGIQGQRRRAALLAQRRLGYAAPALDEAGSETTATDLAWAGWKAAAQERLDQGEGSVEERFEAYVVLSESTRAPLSAPEDLIGDWLASSDGLSRLDAIADVLVRLDIADALSGRGAMVILDAGWEVIQAQWSSGYGIPSQDQTLAAMAPSLGRPEIAKRILAETTTHYDSLSEPSPLAHNPTGWAWRSLALHRLNRREEADVAQRRAGKEGRVQLLASRTWGEWRDILVARALAEAWPECFDAAAGPGDARVRFELRCLAVELYSERVIEAGREPTWNRHLRRVL